MVRLLARREKVPVALLAVASSAYCKYSKKRKPSNEINVGSGGHRTLDPRLL